MIFLLRKINRAADPARIENNEGMQAQVYENSPANSSFLDSQPQPGGGDGSNFQKKNGAQINPLI
jgi:hypothetical protein